ncbi:MAG: hypothetical protein GY757_21395, partial [bacterium]|nr:hypothetical protein [bacterium]
MKKFFLIIILFVLLLTSPFVFAAKLATLPELMKPKSISIDGTQMYVVESATHSIHLYSMKDYKLIKQFGKKGEGPGEYKRAPYVMAFTDHVLLFAAGKNLYYSRSGDYLKEKRIDNGIVGLWPVKDSYVGMRIPTPGSRNIAVYDSQV